MHPFSADVRLQALASEELARAAVHMRDVEGLPIVAFDLAGSEKVCGRKPHSQMQVCFQ